MDSQKPSSSTNTTSTSSNQGGSSSEPKKKENLNSIDINKYRAYIEEIRSKNLNVSDMLAASFNNIIRPEDSIIYFPKNMHLIGDKYPAYPLRLKEELLQIFDIDTLFFIFFQQQNRVAKEMARKEIIKRGWMYNSKNFMKLKGEAKISNEEYIEGYFELFDHEKEWKIKTVNNYKFVLKDSKK